jgi:hypothetical protein
MKSLGDILANQLLAVSREIQSAHELAILLDDDELASDVLEMSRQCAVILGRVLSRVANVTEDGRVS